MHMHIEKQRTNVNKIHWDDLENEERHCQKLRKMLINTLRVLI